MSRLDELRSLYSVAMESISDVEPDKRASLIREARFLLLEMEQVAAEVPAEGPVNPLDELRARRSQKSA